MTNRANEYAFPHGNFDGNKGMTIREKIAAMTMQGLLANSFYAAESAKFSEPNMDSRLAQRTVQITDTLIAELSKPTEK